jgi:hypothetical protein
MKITYSSIAIIIEYIREKASQEEKELTSIDKLVEYLDENTDSFINFK